MIAFEPTKRDWDGLLRLMDDIKRDRFTRRGEHQGYQIACFSQDEAFWIRCRLLAWRPELVGRVGVSWLDFHA